MNYLLNSTIIAIIFALFRYIHTKFILKETVIPKPIIIDSIFVFTASIVTIYTIEKFNLDEITSSKNIQAFVNNPDF